MEGTKTSAHHDSEIALAHRRTITYVDRVYGVGMLALILLYVWRWLRGESSLIGVGLLVSTVLFSFLITEMSLRAPDSRKIEPWRYPVLYLVGPALFFHTDPASAFLAIYLFMGVGASAVVAMVGAKPLWSWLNLTLWAVNLCFAYALLPDPLWHYCFVMVTILLVFGAAVHGLTSSLRTATLQARQRTDELRRSQLELARSTKFAALGEMAGGIAHEVNTPLTVIHLKASQLMRLANQGTLDMDTLRHIAGTMESTARHIGSIVSSLRMFARQGKATPFEPQDLRDIVREALKLSRERPPFKDVLLESNVPQEPLVVECRSVPVTQVLVNLLNNALDAVASQSKKWVAIDVRDKGDKAEIRVSDCGPGIPADKRGLLFQPFFTTKEIGKGTGLGLSISKGIVESHHGRLFLDTNAPHTTFVVLLPKRPPKDLGDLDL